MDLAQSSPLVVLGLVDRARVSYRRDLRLSMSVHECEHGLAREIGADRAVHAGFVLVHVTVSGRLVRGCHGGLVAGESRPPFGGRIVRRIHDVDDAPMPHVGKVLDGYLKTLLVVTAEFRNARSLSAGRVLHDDRYLGLLDGLGVLRRVIWLAR